MRLVRYLLVRYLLVTISPDLYGYNLGYGSGCTVVGLDFFILIYAVESFFLGADLGLKK